MNKIEKIPVASSNIEAIGFDHATANSTSPARATLRVWFKNGTVYDYEDVWQGEFEKLKSAPSVGAYFSANIKDKYSSKKL